MLPAPSPDPLTRYAVDEYGCWIWQGATYAKCYGGVRTRSGWLLAHRVVYELVKGPIPQGLVLDHRCAVKKCVNPDHLEAVTCGENARRGRHRVHCPRCSCDDRVVDFRKPESVPLAIIDSKFTGLLESYKSDLRTRLSDAAARRRKPLPIMPEDWLGPVKTCSSCQRELPATVDFFYRVTGKSDLLRPKCRPCHAGGLYGAPGGPPPVSPLDRVIENASGCWEWTGSKHRRGYGVLKWLGKSAYAHRVVFMLLVGPIPEGKVLDHRCFNTSCVNPDHLEVVTQKLNTKRAYDRRHCAGCACAGNSLAA
jgi:hypothetical protein